MLALLLGHCAFSSETPVEKASFFANLLLEHPSDFKGPNDICSAVTGRQWCDDGRTQIHLIRAIVLTCVCVRQLRR